MNTSITKLEYLDKFEINWQIEGLDIITKMTGQTSIHSRNFTSTQHPKAVWEMRIVRIPCKTKGMWLQIQEDLDDSYFDFVKFYLKMVEYGHPSQLKIKYRCDATLTYNEENKPEKTTLKLMKMDFNGIKLPEIELFSLKGKSFSKLNNVQIECVIQTEPQIVHLNSYKMNGIFGEIETTSAEVKMDQKKIEKNAKFFTKILEDSPDDIEISCKGTKFKIHKFLLTVQSEVFRKMFAVDLSESQTKQIEIEDFEPEIVQVFLNYLKKMSNPAIICVDENAVGLFMMAHKYQVVELKADCEDKLCQNINLQNVIEMLELSELYNLVDLKDTALKFIVSKKGQLDYMKAFDQLAEKNPGLFIEIQNEVCKNDKFYNFLHAKFRKYYNELLITCTLVFFLYLFSS